MPINSFFNSAWKKNNPNATQIIFNTFVCITATVVIITIIAAIKTPAANESELERDILNNPDVISAKEKLEESFSSEQVNALFNIFIVAAASLLGPLNRTLLDISWRITLSVATSLGITWALNTIRYSINHLSGRAQVNTQPLRFIQEHPAATKTALGLILPMLAFFSVLYFIYFAENKVGPSSDLQKIINGTEAFQSALATLVNNFGDQTTATLKNVTFIMASDSLPVVSGPSDELIASVMYSAMLTFLYHEITNPIKEGINYLSRSYSVQWFKERPKLKEFIIHSSLFLIAASCCIPIFTTIDTAFKPLTPGNLVERISQDPAFNSSITELSAFDETQQALIRNASLAVAAETMEPVASGMTNVFLYKLITAFTGIVAVKYLTDILETATKPKLEDAQRLLPS